MPRLANYEEHRTKTRATVGIEVTEGWWELNAAVDAGGSAEADYIEWNSVTSAYAVSTYSETLYAVHPTEEYAADDWVEARWNPYPSRWEIRSGSAIRKASWIEFNLDQALGLTDASKTATVDNYSDGRNPGATVTVWNMNESGGNYVFEGGVNDIGYALYHPRDDRYYIIQMECP